MDLLQQGHSFAFIPLFYSTVIIENQSASRILFGGGKSFLMILAGFYCKRFLVNFTAIGLQLIFAILNHIFNYSYDYRMLISNV
jgi:hypothetical protein